MRLTYSTRWLWMPGHTEYKRVPRGGHIHHRVNYIHILMYVSQKDRSAARRREYDEVNYA
jgi:hypothetical protein